MITTPDTEIDCVTLLDLIYKWTGYKLINTITVIEINLNVRNYHSDT